MKWLSPCCTPAMCACTQLIGASHFPLHPLNRRRVPFTIERFGLWSIQPHGQVERSLGRWQPVGVLVFAGALVLEV